MRPGVLPLGAMVLLGVLSCVLPEEKGSEGSGGPDPQSIPKLSLDEVWRVDDLFPGPVPMNLVGSTLLVPLWSNPGGLAAIDVRDGSTLWKNLGQFRPSSSAVVYGDRVFCIGYYVGDQVLSMIWLDDRGNYRGRYLLESRGNPSPRFFRIYLVGDAIYWGDGFAGPDDRSSNFWRFGAAGPFEDRGGGIYGADCRVLFHPRVEGGDGITGAVAGDVVLGVDGDVVFTYYHIFGTNTRREPQNVIRMKPTGEVVWDYPTKVARQFGDRDLFLVGDKILVSGTTGTELIDARDPLGTAPVWARGSSEYNSVGNGLVAADTYFGLSLYVEKAINAYSMATGERLWTLPNTTSVGQGPQFYEGKLFVAEMEGILVVDAQRGTWLGRDDGHKGFRDQVNVTFSYDNLFIHFATHEGSGYVEALDMSHYEK